MYVYHTPDLSGVEINIPYCVKMKNINLVKKGIGNFLWDTDGCYYSTKKEDIIFEKDRRRLVITFKLHYESNS